MWVRASVVSSPSRKAYSSLSDSAQSGFSSSTGRGLLRGQATLCGELVQRLLQRLSSAMQPAHHRTDGDVEDLGDLLVRKAFHVGEQHGQPEVLRERLDRTLHLGLGEQVHELVFGAATLASLLEAPDALVEVEVLDVVEVGLLGAALLRSVPVDERVGEDPVQ